MSGHRRLERTIEAALTVGLTASGLLLIAGLILGRPDLLTLGMIALMATPGLRLIVLTAGLLLERDWIFAAVSLWILGVLGSSLWVALRIAAGR